MAEGGHKLDISCSICFEEYEVDPPKVLTCGHTFCYKCINNMVKRQRGQVPSLECPKCRRDVLPPSGDIENLPTNFELLSIIDDQHQQEKKKNEAPEKESPNNGTKKQCVMHKNPTNFYCKTCKKWVCAECLHEDHTPDKHEIFSKSVTSFHFVKKLSAKVCTVEVKLQHYRTLHMNVQEQSQNQEQESFRQALGKLLDELTKTTAACEVTFRDLNIEHNDSSTLSGQIHKNCTLLQQKFKETSSNDCKFKELLGCIQALKVDVQSLKLICQTIHTEIDIKFYDTFQRHFTGKQPQTKLAEKTAEQLDVHSLPNNAKKTTLGNTSAYIGVNYASYEDFMFHNEENDFYEEYGLNEAAQYEDEYDQSLIDAAQFEEEQALYDAARYEDEYNQSLIDAAQFDQEQALNDAAQYEEEYNQSLIDAAQFDQEQALNDAAQYEDEYNQSLIDAAQYEDEYYQQLFM